MDSRPQESDRSKSCRHDRLLVEACASLPNVPSVLINGSAIGYYGPRDNQPLREDDHIGSGFLADLCRDWEQAAMAGERLGMRVVRVRIGMVLGRNGGALPRMFLPFRLFLGGPIAPGTQWVSWIHLEDLARLLQWAVTTASVTGAVNAVSPPSNSHAGIRGDPGEGSWPSLVAPRSGFRPARCPR